MALFALICPSGADFGFGRQHMRLAVPLCRDRKPLYGLDQAKTGTFLEWGASFFILKSWIGTR
jgi:hypothetical protein